MPEGLFGIRVQFVLGGTGLRLARDANELRPAVPSPGAVLFYGFHGNGPQRLSYSAIAPGIHFLKFSARVSLAGCVLIHSGGR